MITFGPIILDHILGDKRRRRVREDIEVRLNGSYLCTIQAGFVSDGMSFPIWQWTWDDPWHERYVGAALLHDWLLKYSDLPKWQIDWLFEGALRDAGVSALETWIFTNAVRTRRRRRP